MRKGVSAEKALEILWNEENEIYSSAISDTDREDTFENRIVRNGAYNSRSLNYYYKKSLLFGM